MPAPAEIVQLVELFQRNEEQYRSPAFSEAAVRHQFVDPLFAALGWDVNNTQGFAEQYKEVVHEDKVHGGFGGELAARIVAELFPFLDAPVERVGSTFTPVGFHRVLERAILPDVARVLNAARKTLAY